MFGVLPSEVRDRYARLKLPVLSLSFTDYESMSARDSDSLHAFYRGAARDMRRIAPAEIGASAIGHFGIFRKRFENSLRPRAGDWLDRQAGPAH